MFDQTFQAMDAMDNFRSNTIATMGANKLIEAQLQRAETYGSGAAAAGEGGLFSGGGGYGGAGEAVGFWVVRLGCCDNGSPGRTARRWETAFGCSAVLRHLPAASTRFTHCVRSA